MLSLDDLGVVEGTDKSSVCHGYLEHYDRMFGGWRDAPITLVEIGVFDGASLRAWRKYFSRARIVGLDIDPACLRHAAEGIEVVIGSQTDAAFLAEVARWTRPSIIIDDGSHRADDIMFTFERMFESLLPGGCYIIEDLDAHVGPNASFWRGNAKCPPTEHFARFFEAVATKQRSDIDRVEAIRNAVAIWKAPVRSLELVQEKIERLLDSDEATAESLYCYALFLRDRRQLGRAQAAISRAIERGGPKPWFLEARDKIQARARDEEVGKV